MRVRSLFILILIFSFGLVANVKALDLGFAKEDAGHAGAFLDFAASARSLGMGRAHVAVADDAGATYWNPAGLAQLHRKDLVTLYSSLEEDTGFGFMGYAQPTIDWGTFGLGILNLRSTDFEKRDFNGVQVGTFDQNDVGILVSHGFKYRNKLSLGSTIKVVRQEIDSINGTGFGFDLGFMWDMHRRIKMGLSAHNLLAPKIKLNEESDEYPRDVRLGLAYTPSQNWLLTTDLNQTQDRDLKFHFGTEWKIKQLLALRTGINETEVTAGLGFTLGDWTIDYAFGYNDAAAGIDDLGGSHRFGFHLNFGGLIEDEKVSARTQRKGQKLLAALSKKMDDPKREHDLELEKLVDLTMVVIRKRGFIKPADLYQARAYVHFFKGDFERAVQAFSEAMDLSESSRKNIKPHHEIALAHMSEERTREIVEFEIWQARTFYQKDQLRDAVKSAKKVLSFEPENEEARKFLVDAQKRINAPIQRELRLAKKKYEEEKYLEAMNHLLRVKEMDPHNKEAARYMGHAMGALKKQASIEFRMNNPQKRTVFELGRNPSKSQEFYSKGLLYYSQGKIKDAVSSWEKAVKLDESNSLAKNAYHRALLELEENAER